MLTLEQLQKLWPIPFKVEKGNLTNFIVTLIIFIVVCAVFGILIGVLSSIPVLGIIFMIVGSLVNLYGLVGIVLCILRFCGVI
ncbi:unknown [Clostridium sp. CAG:448]|nr:unknown [Clostridium sp. CAG:448]